MLGPEGVGDAVAAFAADAVPASCVRLGIDVPATFITHDLIDVNAVPSYPAVIVVVLDVTAMRLDDREGDDLTFSVDYRVQLHVLARANQKDDVAGAERARNQLWRAAAEAFLLDPSLGGGAVALSKPSITGAMHRFDKDSQNRIVSSGHLDLPVRAAETLSSDPLAAPPLVPVVVITETL